MKYVCTSNASVFHIYDASRYLNTSTKIHAHLHGCNVTRHGGKTKVPLPESEWGNFTNAF